MSWPATDRGQASRARTALAGAALALALLASAAGAQADPAAGEPPPGDASPGDTPLGADDLAVGHWVRVKGAFDAEGVFVAEALEVREPSDKESLLGTASDVDATRGQFLLLGFPVHVSARTEWNGVTLEDVAGARVSVEGHHRGPNKFSARKVSRRELGRDRLEGRLDRIEPGPDGRRLSVLSTGVWLPASVAIEHERPLGSYALAPERPAEQARPVRSDDDDIPDGVSLSETVDFGGVVEWKLTRRDNFDLDDAKRRNRTDQTASLRGEFLWEPSDAFFALAGFRAAFDTSDEEQQPTDRQHDRDLTEAYGYWLDPFGGGIDLQVGRQDFDEPREWLYDRNLDAVRAIWAGVGARLDLSASTVLTDGDPKDRDTRNLIAYLSNNDWDRHAAVWVMSRRNATGAGSDPLHVGVRLLGAWLPDQDVWAEAAVLRGSAAGEDLSGWGIDVGTTWSPPDLDPWMLTAGFARGSGDEDPGDGTNSTFHQTGLNDNNGKFGGVSSFRYYGEVLDPELSNLQVLTLGVGRRLDAQSSVDLVAHSYRQPEPSATLGKTDLKAKADGIHRDLGNALDLILGLRPWEHWDVKFIVGLFEPGRAFPGGDAAFTAKLQIRYRF